jgi:5-methylcytosine-specific restriction endonuclease McrA
LAREISGGVHTAALAREVSTSVHTAALAREALPCLDAAALGRKGMAGALDAPQRYRVQFTAGEECVQLIERAKALLPGGAGKGGELAEIHLRALRMLVVELEKQKYGAARASRRGERAERVDCRPSAQVADPPQRSEGQGRYVPAGERRAVFERDGARCSYIDGRGQRCRETRCLELHHVAAFARGGANVAENLALFCRAHNTLAAEEEFGRSLVDAVHEKGSHESWAAQKRR